MSRIAATIGALREARRKMLVPFITAGDPHPRHTVAMMHGLVKGGADIIELGVPFSDPMADGPVIQLASERALAAGMTLRGLLALVAEFRRTDQRTPVVLMGYLNPIDHFGPKAFAQAASRAGVDGVLVVDLPVEESSGFTGLMREEGIDCIFLLAPTSPPERIRRVAEQASGYLYYVSLKGVTGAANLDVGSVAAKLAEIRTFTDLPLAVGFGIRDADSARKVGAVADGVIVGTALVTQVEKHGATPEALPDLLAQTLRPIRDALDALDAV